MKDKKRLEAIHERKRQMAMRYVIALGALFLGFQVYGWTEILRVVYLITFVVAICVCLGRLSDNGI
jgi:heme/copper-type cytochrome/quinol oxidase subunit 3